MREKLEGRQYVERYVHTLTHEMKSPLAAIHGAALLLEEDVPDAERRRFVTNIREQEERLQHLVERMLDLATIQHRQSLQDPCKLSLAELVNNVLVGKETRIAQRGLNVDISIPASANVSCEAFLLEQAISNLLDNAMEFSPKDGLISIDVESVDNRHVIRIRDQGPGIPDFAVERILEPFYSLPRPDTQKKSTGLGLSFVKEVAELHQGSIEVRNRPEGGVEARLILPVV
jgi:two-component system sensor histidine kinase CreC